MFFFVCLRYLLNQQLSEREAGSSQPGRWTREGRAYQCGDGGTGDGGNDGGRGSRPEAWSKNDEGQGGCVRKYVCGASDCGSSFWRGWVDGEGGEGALGSVVLCVHWGIELLGFGFGFFMRTTGYFGV